MLTPGAGARSSDRLSQRLRAARRRDWSGDTCGPDGVRAGGRARQDPLRSSGLQSFRQRPALCAGGGARDGRPRWGARALDRRRCRGQPRRLALGDPVWISRPGAGAAQ